MSDTVIKIQNVSKHYRLGAIGARTLSADLSRYWARRRGKPDPLSKVGHQNKRKGAYEREGHDLWALRDITFDVRRGAVMGVIGHNGAGKSTLLKILSRVTGPTDGEVRLKGRIASLLEVGTGFHPELTGRENIYLNGAILGMRKSEIRSKLDAIVDFSGVEQFIDTPVKRYSSGMTVRLAFSVAAHLEPEILVIDEVLAVGDAEFQKKCLGKMSAVARGGRTVLFVSHNMAAVQNLCSEAMVLLAGRMIYRGDSRDAIAFYLNQSNQSPEAREQKKWIAKNRASWAAPYIVAARTVAADGSTCGTFDLGSDLGIEMDVECPSGNPIRQPVMGVVLNHALFGPVATVNMRMTGSDKHIGKFQKLTIRGLIKQMPFVQGNYSIDLWLGDGPRDIDLVNGCLSFDIAGTDIYGTGKLPSTKFGIVFLNADWEVSTSRSGLPETNSAT